MELNAEWIWLSGARQTPDFYCFARKSFLLGAHCTSAELHITAYTDYILYVNGAYVGRGPSPSNGKVMMFDTWDISGLLGQGRNAIAVLAHNYGVGVHWNPAGPGGLIALAKIRCGGQTVEIPTDETWKMRAAACYDRCAPRRMFSCRFTEVFHMERVEEGWNTAAFDDRGWETAEVIGPTPVFPYERLLPRPIPHLREKRIDTESAEKARCAVEGFHAVNFRQIEAEGTNSVYYATACFHSEIERECTLVVSCDDAFRAFLNGRTALEQSYNEEFMRKSLFWGREEFEQIHDGIGPRSDNVRVRLCPGWNRLTVAVDQGPRGWGFAAGFHDGASVDDRTDIRLLPLSFSSEPDGEPSCWILSGPFESSGMKNSLEKITDVIPAGGKTALLYPSLLSVTDCELMMRAEKRYGFEASDLSKPVMLGKGDCLIVDFGRMDVGYPTLEIESSGEALLDVCFGNVLSEDKKICGMGDMRSVDRLYLVSGKFLWECAGRRDGRYLHISCRKGTGVLLGSISLTSVGYPVESKDSFECSDELLNLIYVASKHSTALIMQHDYEDCLKREEGLHNGRNVIHAFAGSYYAFGDGRLLKKMFLDLLATQDDRGWLSGSGFSDDTNDEISKAMWALEYLLRYYEFTGDSEFVKQVYEQVRCFMRYLSRLENKLILIDGKNEFNNARGRSLWIDDHVQLDDYPDRNQTLFSFNALYYGTLLNMAKLSEAAESSEDASFYRRKAGFLRESFNRVFWDETNQMYVDWVWEGEKAAGIQDVYLILALYYGICDAEKERRAMCWLFDEHTGTLRNIEDWKFTFGFYYFIFEVLCRHRMPDFAYRVLRSYFGTWLSLGFTAFGEHFTLPEAKGRKTLGREINVHTDSTAAHPFFYSHILGIRPVAPGFRSIVVEPLPGDICWAKGSVYTPLGNVCVQWSVHNGSIDVEASVPEGIECRIIVPKDLTAGQLITVTEKFPGTLLNQQPAGLF